jgi:Spy/CpxP family protein refolding chaperone
MNAKIWKHGLLVAGAFVIFGAPVLTSAAGVPQDAGQSQTAPAPAMQNGPSRPDLNLTDDQKAQMKKFHEDARAQIGAVRNDSTLSADQKEAKIRQIHMNTEKQTHEILTPEQRKMMKEYRHEKKEGQQQPQQPPPTQ